MWWAIGIFGGVCFVAALLCFLIAGAKRIGEETHRKSILKQSRKNIWFGVKMAKHWTR